MAVIPEFLIQSRTGKHKSGYISAPQESQNPRSSVPAWDDGGDLIIIIRYATLFD